MADMLCYNGGSLLAALNPSEYFEYLSAEGFMESVDDTYKQSCSIDGVVYGIPSASAQAGAILYTKEVYEKYHLEIPKTWMRSWQIAIP